MAHDANLIKRKLIFFVFNFQKSSNPIITSVTVFLLKLLKTRLSLPSHFTLCPNLFSGWSYTFHYSILRKKSSRIDLITAEMAHQLSKIALIHLTHILNFILRFILFYWMGSIIYNFNSQTRQILLRYSAFFLSNKPLTSIIKSSHLFLALDTLVWF